MFHWHPNLTCPKLNRSSLNWLSSHMLYLKWHPICSVHKSENVLHLSSHPPQPIGYQVSGTVLLLSLLGGSVSLDQTIAIQVIFYPVSFLQSILHRAPIVVLLSSLLLQILWFFSISTQIFKHKFSVAFISLFHDLDWIGRNYHDSLICRTHSKDPKYIISKCLVF